MEKKRIKRREYKSVELFEADVRLMCENAKAYNEDASQIHKDAVVLLVGVLSCYAIRWLMLTLCYRKSLPISRKQRKPGTIVSSKAVALTLIRDRV